MVGITFKKRLLNIVHLESYTSYKEYQETNQMKVPLDSFITYCIYKYCTSKFVTVRFIPVQASPEKISTAVTLVEKGLIFLLDEYEIPWPVALCAYPVIMCEDVIITGLASVTRHICLFKTCHPVPQEHESGLLGFRQSCLQAPNEVSIWTKFCEVDIIKTVQGLLTADDIKVIPINLVRFEDHLKKPVRVHNVYKIARNIAKENVNTRQETSSGPESHVSQEINAELKVDTEQQVSKPQSSSKTEATAAQHVSNEPHSSAETEAKAEQQMSNEPQSIAEPQATAEPHVCNEPQATAEQQVSNEPQSSSETQATVVQQAPSPVPQTSSEPQVSADQQVSAAETASLASSTPSDTSRTSKSRKWKSHKKKEQIIESSTKIEDLNVNHDYAEGPFLTLADLVLFPSYHIMVQSIGETVFESLLPFTYKWYKNLSALTKIQECFLTYMSEFNLKPLSHENITMPTSEDVSLYKRDPKRHNPKKRMFTKEEDIEKALSFVTEEMEVSDNDLKLSFKWSEIPEGANPYAGHLPDARVQRKSQQLENLAMAVLRIAKEGDVIVDFCCGSGHLGILLAHLLPRCAIILLDNKVQSLYRARDRVHKMRMKNVFFFQCNLDFFIGDFDIGTGLHACGIATDLILDKCLKVNAKFVISPCCYGSLLATDRLAYPRSKKASSVPIEHYMCIGHTADQTHKDHPLSDRGSRCMGIIDSDRGCLAEESGYKVTLMKMKPLTCTPKNNLLIGVPENQL
uniref:GST C-terminal domain-containing protein n=1 Tax=Heliothis virescens TaxID=7102 RepID=A0A2A4ISK8_HELVI